MKTVFLAFSITDSSVTDYFVELANQLSQRYQVIIIADKMEAHRFDIASGITVWRWPSDRPKNFSDFTFLVKKVWRFKPRIMISMFGSVNMFLLVGWLMRVKHRIAWSRTISTASPATKSMLLRKSVFYKFATKVLANSNATKQDLVEHFDVSANKIDVVYNAVREYETKSKTIDPDRIVYVGSLIPMKGVDTLFEAMPAVLKKFPNVKLEMVGGYFGGNSMKNYVEKAKALGIDRSVVFHGRQHKQSVLEILSGAYFSVAPSLAEAFGFNVIESYSVKTPVIGSDSTGIAEIIRHNHDGFLFATKNPDALAVKMITLLESKDLRDTFSKECYAHFLDDFEVRRNVTKLVQYLDDL